MIALPSITPVLAALALSLAANGVLGWAWLGQRDDTTAAISQRDQARGDATACSDATEALRDQANKRRTAAAPARADLGNAQPGDGKRFMGRGLIQTTGRANYCATRDGLRKFVPDVPDFEADPAALEQAEWAALSAAWYWHSRGLNALADVGDYKRITVRVNGGTNGMADRLALWEKAKDALGVAA